MMKSFICETDCGEMIITIKFCPEYKNFALYLHGIQNDQYNTGIHFYQDKSLSSVAPNRVAILKAVNRLVSYHHYWTAENQAAFEKWFDKLWKEFYSEFGSELVFMEEPKKDAHEETLIDLSIQVAEELNED